MPIRAAQTVAEQPARILPGEYRKDLDRAKGLAIILVVFGHLVAREGPAGVGWYEPLRMVVYLFHMPFFLYLSGTVAGISGAAFASPTAWPALARRRAGRLLIPFLGFGLLILAGKLALAPVAVIDNIPSDIATGLLALIWDTGASPATSVWYLLALFVFALATPVLWNQGGIITLILVAGALYLVPAPPLAYLDRICGYFGFFVAGVLAARHMTAWEAALDRWRAATLVAFAAVLLLAWSGALAVQGTQYKAWLLMAGLLAMPALHGLARAWTSAVLLWLGQRSFAIYLLNTICIGLAKAALLRVVAWDGANFLPFAAGLMAAGLLGPIAIAAAARSIAARVGGWWPAPPASTGIRR